MAEVRRAWHARMHEYLDAWILLAFAFASATRQEGGKIRSGQAAGTDRSIGPDIQNAPGTERERK